MPIIKSKFTLSITGKNGHLHTLIPFFVRKAPILEYTRERIKTSDDDFLDLDWHKIIQDNQKLVIISHGLEGSSKQAYILGMGFAFKEEGWDVLAWNFRSCSGELNQRARFYHSGDSLDLDQIVEHVLAKNKYRQIMLVGFSLGANVTLKWLGEKAQKLPAEIMGGIAFSVPCDLGSSSTALGKKQNMLYMANFLFTMKKKLLHKWKLGMLRNQNIDYKRAMLARDFPSWDNTVTAPLHGFESANDYYQRSSSKQFLSSITVPTLIVNALNDPFLSPECFPHELAEKSQLIHLEVPEVGGHVGFMRTRQDIILWSEWRAVEFMKELSEHQGV